jgi:uncharacterized repeat protein (TIGR03803 family)
VFKLNKAGKETILYNFTGGADGGYPSGGLLLDSSGTLYGTTTEWDYAYGNVFKLDTNRKLTVLYSFSGGLDGNYPEASLIQDAAGNLYGITYASGVGQCPQVIQAGCGTIYKIDATGLETVLYRFTGGVDGGSPQATLLLDAQGNLYGTTWWGGTSGLGTVFELDTAGQETVLYSFTGGSDGANPIRSLLRNAVGNLYGTAFNGGIGFGTVFMLPNGGQERTLYSFPGRQTERIRRRALSWMDLVSSMEQPYTAEQMGTV